MIFSKLLKYFFLKFDYLAYKKWNHQPLTKFPIRNKETYYKLWEKAKFRNNPEVDNYEKITGYKIDVNWLDELALKTQVVVKQNELNYAHGKIIYSALREYISKNFSSLNKINILETGTARGFSSLCMAKALYDSNIPGSIFTFDVLPHRKKIYWNCITDHLYGPITREKLLNPWKRLISDYIIFFQGYSNVSLGKINLDRIHFAFLDGAHTYEDVIFEFNILKDQQKKGDVIVFDDYNKKLFPNIVKAVDEICDKFFYKKLVIQSFDHRSYVIAEKK